MDGWVGGWVDISGCSNDDGYVSIYPTLFYLGENGQRRLMEIVMVVTLLMLLVQIPTHALLHTWYY